LAKTICGAGCFFCSTTTLGHLSGTARRTFGKRAAAIPDMVQHNNQFEFALALDEAPGKSNSIHHCWLNFAAFIQALA